MVTRLTTHNETSRFEWTYTPPGMRTLLIGLGIGGKDDVKPTRVLLPAMVTASGYYMGETPETFWSFARARRPGQPAPRDEELTPDTLINGYCGPSHTYRDSDPARDGLVCMSSSGPGVRSGKYTAEQAYWNSVFWVGPYSVGVGDEMAFSSLGLVPIRHHPETIASFTARETARMPGRHWGLL